MGHNTTVLIMNDGFQQIRENPSEFIEGIYGAMYDGGSIGAGNHGNCGQVMRTAHADQFRLYSSHGNLMLDLSPYSETTLRHATGPKHLRDYVDEQIAQAERSLEALKQRIADMRAEL